MIIISLSLSVPAPPATTRRTRRLRLRSGASPSSPPCGRPAGPPAPPPTPATSPWPPSPGCWSRWRAAGREAAWSPSPPSSSSLSQTTEIKGTLSLTSGLFCLLSYWNVIKYCYIAGRPLTAWLHTGLPWRSLSSSATSRAQAVNNNLRLLLTSRGRWTKIFNFYEKQIFPVAAVCSCLLMNSI